MRLLAAAAATRRKSSAPERMPVNALASGMRERDRESSLQLIFRRAYRLRNSFGRTFGSLRSFVFAAATGLRFLLV